MPAILEVEDLRLHYLTRLGKRVQAVDGVSFQLQPGEILGIAGESGCGKTTLVSGLMGLLMPPLHLTSGAVRIAGRDILRLPPAEVRRSVLGRDIAMIPQGALNSLNRQKAPMAARLHELQSAIQRFDQEICTWQSRIEQSVAENARFAEQVESQRGAIASIEEHLQGRTEERAAAFEKVSALETQLVQLRQQLNGLGDSRNRLEVQLTRVDLRLENLVNQVQERYSFHISAFEPDYHALMLSIAEQKKSRSRGEKRKSGTEAEPTSEASGETPRAEASAEQPPEPAGGETDEETLDLEQIELPGEEGHPDWDFVAGVVERLALDAADD